MYSNSIAREQLTHIIPVQLKAITEAEPLAAMWYRPALSVVSVVRSRKVPGKDGQLDGSSPLLRIQNPFTILLVGLT